MLLALLMHRSRALAFASRSFLAKMASLPSYESAFIGARSIGAITGEVNNWERSRESLGVAFLILKSWVRGGDSFCSNFWEFCQIIMAKVTD